MTLQKDEIRRRKIATAYKEIKSALSAALEKATLIEKEMEEEGINPLPLSKEGGISDEQVSQVLVKSRARRNITIYSIPKK